MSFLGWIIETIYRSYNEKKYVNAGFLYGPFLPIYGFGSVIITGIYMELQRFPEPFFWAITILSPTILEYFASLIMEKIFKLKLWDYKENFFNINGRICLKFSIIWACLAILLVLVIQPAVFKRIMIMGLYYSHFIAGGLLAYLILDLDRSVKSLVNFKEFQNNISKLIEEGRKFSPLFDINAEGKGIKRKLPKEIRHLLKPLNSFPHLRKSFKEKSHIFPKWINDLLNEKFKKWK